jgi:hypothetical protein
MKTMPAIIDLPDEIGFHAIRNRNAEKRDAISLVNTVNQSQDFDYYNWHKGTYGAFLTPCTPKLSKGEQ